MGIKSTITKSLGAAFNVKRWVGFDKLREDGEWVSGVIKNRLASLKSPANQSTSFAECIKRYRLTDEQINHKKIMAKRAAMVCAALGGVTFFYALYLMFTHKYMGGFVACMLMLLALAHAFREHFNYFQLSQRRLGCTVRDWWAFLVNEQKGS